MCIIRTDELKTICNKITLAIDSSSTEEVAGALCVEVKDNTLFLSVTNKEYYVSIRKVLTGTVSNFKTVVDADLFIKLISKITTETVELSISSGTLIVKGNGQYKLAMLYSGQDLMEVPEILLNKVEVSNTVKSENLADMLQHNSKEFSKVPPNTALHPIQKMYYMDEKGCITFTQGACVNYFDLENPFKILLGQKLVKLFKLFKDEEVTIDVGEEKINEEFTQTRIRLYGEDVKICAILGGDNKALVNKVPVVSVRNRAETLYDYEIEVSKAALLETIGRILLFANIGKSKVPPYCRIVFDKNYMTIFDTRQENNEQVVYENPVFDLNDNAYSTIVEMNNFKSTIESFTDKTIVIKFSNHTAMTIESGNIVYVFPEHNTRA